MPNYTFLNEESGMEYDIQLSIHELDDYKKKYPSHRQVLIPTAVIGGTSYNSGKLPEGFKDRLREMKKKHPRAGGVNHLI